MRDRVKRERRQSTRSEEHVLPFAQQLPVGELLAKSKPAVIGEAEDVELLVIQEFRGAYLPVIHLDRAQVFAQVFGLHSRCFGTVAGVYFTSTHGPLSTNSNGVEERGHPPSGPFFSSWVAILWRLTDESKAR
jgi:hypothetical protein